VDIFSEEGRNWQYSVAHTSDNPRAEDHIKSAHGTFVVASDAEDTGTRSEHSVLLFLIASLNPALRVLQAHLKPQMLGFATSVIQQGCLGAAEIMKATLFV
jgi:hypothetical protein